MRAERPSWWPCDESGQLRANSGLVPPAPAAAAECDGFTANISTHTPPPQGSAIECESATAFRYVPAWSDACDPKSRIATQFMDETGSSSGSTPSWWPCDGDGNFIASPYFTEM
jgi:hypothetical protein